MRTEDKLIHLTKSLRLKNMIILLWKTTENILTRLTKSLILNKMTIKNKNGAEYKSSHLIKSSKYKLAKKLVLLKLKLRLKVKMINRAHKRIRVLHHQSRLLAKWSNKKKSY